MGRGSLQLYRRTVPTPGPPFGLSSSCIGNSRRSLLPSPRKVGGGDSPEAFIPLSFKLKIARELYEGLTGEEKKEIDRRREEDKVKMSRKVYEIDDAGERVEKLLIHQRYSIFPATS